MERERIKMLIELSSSYNDANDVIEKYVGLKNYAEKIAYIRGMFDCEIFSRTDDNEEIDYIALLTSVVEKKMAIDFCF